MRTKWLALALLLCSVQTPGVQLQARGGFARGSSWKNIGPPKAVDLNRDPNIVEVFLIAHERSIDLGTGKKTKLWVYNGGTPGPTLEAKVGDTLVVHFINLLPVESTVHWHGVDNVATMDGSNIPQPPVPRFGYFRYEFPLLRPSLFWYHPHRQTNAQVERGLYGALIVHDRDENERLDLPKREHILMLDDILLDDDGQLAEPFPLDDPVANADAHLDGRVGNHLLVNGRVRPTGFLRRGVPHCLRLVNTANTTFMRVSIPGHTLWRIGGDGGLLEAPIAAAPIEQVPDPGGRVDTISDPDLTKGILLTPGERADVVFVPTGRRRLELEWHDMKRGRHEPFLEDGMVKVGHDHHDGKGAPRTLMTFRLYGKGPGTWTPPAALREIERIDTSGLTAADKIVLKFGHTPPDADGEVIFFAQAPGKPFPLVTPADAADVHIGDVKIWEVVNLTGGFHNFHPHGFTFQPIEIEYQDDDNGNVVVPFDFLEDKDTLALPSRPGAFGKTRTILRAAVRFDDTGREGQTIAFGKEPTPDESGGWVVHCHLLEHSASGMMSFFEVKPRE